MESLRFVKTLFCHSELKCGIAVNAFDYFIFTVSFGFRTASVYLDIQISQSCTEMLQQREKVMEFDLKLVD